jgi:TonB family protein
MRVQDMGKSMPGSGAGSVRTANDRWKGGWGNRVAWSTLIGAGVHAVILIVWPMWEISDRRIARTSEMIQIDPIIAYGGSPEEGEDPNAAQPTQEEVAEELAEGGAGGVEIDMDALLAHYGDVAPAVVHPIVPRAAAGEWSRPLPPLNLDFLEMLSPRMAEQALAVILPIIRNPTVLQRFLRTRYNPVFERYRGGAHVSVAMWINDQGAVEWAAVSKSSGYEVLDEIALAVFNDVVQFTPARQEGLRVPVSLVISVPFTSPW